MWKGILNYFLDADLALAFCDSMPSFPPKNNRKNNLSPPPPTPLVFRFTAHRLLDNRDVTTTEQDDSDEGINLY